MQRYGNRGERVTSGKGGEGDMALVVKTNEAKRRRLLQIFTLAGILIYSYFLWYDLT